MTLKKRHFFKTEKQSGFPKWEASNFTLEKNTEIKEQKQKFDDMIYVNKTMMNYRKEKVDPSYKSFKYEIFVVIQLVV